MKERRFLIPEEGSTEETAMERRSRESSVRRHRAKKGLKAGAVVAGVAMGMLASEGQAQAQEKLPVIGGIVMRGAEVGANVYRTQQEADIARRQTEAQRQIQLRQIRAEEEARRREQETLRQGEILRHAEATGSKELEVETTGGKTRINVARGGETTQERMEAERHAHDETMYALQNTVELNRQLKEAIEAGDTAKAGPLALELARREAARKRAEADATRLKNIPGAAVQPEKSK